jgi:hypothetical protein
MFLLWRFNIYLLSFSFGFKGFDLFLMSELRDWNLCIFCQTSNKDKLFNISTFSVSNKFLQDSKLENTMRLGLAGVNDLIAAEGRKNWSLSLFCKYSLNVALREINDRGISPLVCATREQYLSQASDSWSI